MLESKVWKDRVEACEKIIETINNSAPAGMCDLRGKRVSISQCHNMPRQLD